MHFLVYKIIARTMVPRNASLSEEPQHAGALLLGARVDVRPDLHQLQPAHKLLELRETAALAVGHLVLDQRAAIKPRPGSRGVWRPPGRCAPSDGVRAHEEERARIELLSPDVGGIQDERAHAAGAQPGVLAHPRAVAEVARVQHAVARGAHEQDHDGARAVIGVQEDHRHALHLEHLAHLVHAQAAGGHADALRHQPRRDRRAVDHPGRPREALGEPSVVCSVRRRGPPPPRVVVYTQRPCSRLSCTPPSANHSCVVLLQRTKACGVSRTPLYVSLVGMSCHVPSLPIRGCHMSMSRADRRALRMAASRSASCRTLCKCDEYTAQAMAERCGHSGP
eukprot:scaffold734_cov352-Prasinococcus_capsulatus_cf.AAC.3